MSVSNNVAVGNSVLDQYEIKSDRFATGDDLGKDQFLELLVAQMNNQDPLSPQENGEFIAQLAQFSTVEGIENMNTSMEALLSGYQSSQALQASSMVGRTVVVPSDKAIVDTANGLEGQFALPSDSGAVSIKVLNSSGSLVDTINMGSLEAGMHDFIWDGQDSSGNILPPGAYTFEANASIDGTTKQLATLLPANVDSVSLGAGENGELLLNVAGLGSISLSNVYSIK